MAKPVVINRHYQVACPSCGQLEAFAYFGDACQYAQRQQESHRTCGDLNVHDLTVRRGGPRLFDRFGETRVVTARI